MFWGITLENGKKYTQTVKAGFHVSMAALEPQTGGDKHQNVSLMLEHEKAEFLICSLNLNKNQQQPLNLEFTEGEDITFFLTGKGIVHLTGFLTDDMGENEDDDSEEEIAPQLVPLKSKDKKRKSTEKGSPQKRMKASDSDDDDDDSDFFKDVSPDDDSDEDSEDDSEDMVVDVKGKKPNKQMVPAKPPPQQSPSKGPQKGPKPGQQPEGKKDKQKQGKQGPAPPQTPTKDDVNGTGDQDQSGKKKKKKKKNKKKDGDTSISSPQTPTSPKQKQTPPAALGNKTLPSGVIIQDTQAGSGPEAKPGRFVHVYYVGRLHKDNKQFDSNTTGKPFRFRLGKGEVIKGWEDGLQGMKVGGKRKLIIPSAQAYGSKQMGPIPANSTLIFDVELKAVS